MWLSSGRMGDGRYGGGGYDACNAGNTHGAQVPQHTVLSTTSPPRVMLILITWLLSFLTQQSSRLVLTLPVVQ